MFFKMQVTREANAKGSKTKNTGAKPVSEGQFLVTTSGMDMRRGAQIG
jgi:hypothetical protein